MEHNRPGGLTALAIVNFVFAGWELLQAMALPVLIPFLKALPKEELDDEQRRQLEMVTEMEFGLIILLVGMGILTSLLLLISGVGYLKLKKFLGWSLGNAYAVISIIYVVLASQMLDTELTGDFNLLTIIGLIYPAVTLILLNTAFRDDFVN